VLLVKKVKPIFVYFYVCIFSNVLNYYDVPKVAFSNPAKATDF
jgi:hypothetical protein